MSQINKRNIFIFSFINKNVHLKKLLFNTSSQTWCQGLEASTEPQNRVSALESSR